MRPFPKFPTRRCTSITLLFLLGTCMSGCSGTSSDGEANQDSRTDGEQKNADVQPTSNASTGDQAAATGGDTVGGNSGSSTPDPSKGTGGDASTGGDAATGGAESTGGSSPSEPGTLRAAKLEGFGAETTGGEGGEVVVAKTGTEIHRAICERSTDDTPLIILVDGTITPENTSKQSGSCNTKDGVIELKEISNISLIGVERRGILDQIGVHVRASSNIIVQNLTIKNVRKSNTATPSNGGDAIGMESNVSHVWIDHNEIYGSTTSGEEHDGLIDFKAGVTDVTVSYNHLHDSGRGGLIGSNDDGDDGSTRITFHHNWYQHIKSRTHLVREAWGHWYNNYYSEILSTGINSRNGAQLLLEGNYFTESKNPLGTFYYLENPGVWESHDNSFSPSVVWEASSDENIAGPNVQSTGTVTVPYNYTLDSSADVPEIVELNAGVGRL